MAESTFTEKKRQHYIPQFYLRNFSCADSKNNIGLFHFNTVRDTIAFSAIKSQAFEPYYSGKDGTIEDALGKFEQQAAPLIDKIISEKYVPNLGTQEHVLLQYFTLLTELRNPSLPNHLQESFSQTMKTAYSKNDEFKEFFEDHMIVFDREYLITLGMKHLDMHMAFTSDLEYKLILNETTYPFIISDNPVIKYNQFLEARKRPENVTGYSTQGLQILLPLSPHCLMLFSIRGSTKSARKRHE